MALPHRRWNLGGKPTRNWKEELRQRNAKLTREEDVLMSSWKNSIRDIDSKLDRMDKEERTRKKAEAEYNAALNDWLRRTDINTSARVGHRQKKSSRFKDSRADDSFGRAGKPDAAPRAFPPGAEPNLYSRKPKPKPRSHFDLDQEFWKECEEFLRREQEREREYTREKSRRDRAEARGEEEEEIPREESYRQSSSMPSEEFWRSQSSKRKQISEFKRSEWEETWARFCEVGHERELNYEDIPWLPDDCTVSGVLATDTSAERKRKYHTAMLRWHPDKFISAFGKYLVEADRARIEEKVTHTASLLFNEIEAFRSQQSQ
ncbi:hypothetical protein CYMTET_25365 [Cymbomonas tetramitiformis]|uniref:J domain-containing protein n=1 Tax=Cymbomonas tetramitiformis TaxID=36881 RepID=A0AAE0FVH4_9CHLO|nr:hypothetical protein CYMTET_25365 [Cymbomonas tetramitiformis]|eukprot:gene15132-17896_t